MARDYYGSEEYARYYKPYKPAKADDSEYLDLLRHGSDQGLDIMRDTGRENAAGIRLTGSTYAAIPEKVVDNFLKGMKFRGERDKLAFDMDLAGRKEGREADTFAEEQRLRPLKEEQLRAQLRQSVASGTLTEEQAQKIADENDFMTPQRRMEEWQLQRGADRSKIGLTNAQRGLTNEEMLGKRAIRMDLDKPLQAPMPQTMAPAAKTQIPLVIAPERRKAMEMGARLAEEQMMPQAKAPAMPAPRTKRELQSQEKAKKAQMDADYRALQMKKMEKDLAKADTDKKEKDLTAAQAKQLGNTNIGELAEQQYQAAVEKGKKSGNWNPVSATEPIDNTYDLFPKWMKDDAAVDAQAAQDVWVETYLRDASGAAIPPKERPDYAKIWFPQPGDTEQAVQTKKMMRQQKMANAKIGIDEDVAKKWAPGAPQSRGTLKREYSKSRNQTRLTYPDGTVEYINGR